MKKLFVILFSIFIGCLSLNAQTSFLFITKSNVIFEAKTNNSGQYFPAETDAANTPGKFNILSNVDWRIDCSQTWLTVTVQMFYSQGNKGYVYNPHSGSAPDIGAYEYMESYATGSDTAFVLLVAEPNAAASRTAIVTISATGVANQIINVYQRGTEILKRNTPPIIETNFIMEELTYQDTVFQ